VVLLFEDILGIGFSRCPVEAPVYNKYDFPRPNAAVARAAAESINAPKANVDDAASYAALDEGGVPEDSDADPEVDALAIRPQGLLLGEKENGQTKDKNADRPWVKNVRCDHLRRLKKKPGYPRVAVCVPFWRCTGVFAFDKTKWKYFRTNQKICQQELLSLGKYLSYFHAACQEESTLLVF